ncbi:MAG: C10 family peptidase, partial [Sedimentisphaerales bacterium]
MKDMKKILRLCFAIRVYLLSLLCFFVLQGSWCAIVWAKAVPSNLAREVVNGWLAKEAKPMGSRLGSEVENVKTFTDSNGQPVYYVVVLKPNGFVVVSADDLVEPIVCFSSGGSYDSSARNPLGALVSRDIPARINVSRSVHAKLLAGNSTGDLTKQQAMVHKSGEKAFAKWAELLGRWGGHPVSGAEPVSSVSDVRVSPFLQTEWGQDVISCSSDRACYNYYTPGGYGNGDPSNYPAGCVATAMAQYMRFWQYPVSGVGTPSFTITVNGASQTAHLRGGDGSGGAYNWSQMPLAPDCSTTLAQREAIGDLTYDAGVAVKMDYESDGSGAYISDAATAMVDTFGYSNAIKGGDEIDNIGDGLDGMINPNLDYGNPVILGISDFEGDGHAVVADGYGYQSSTLYHHLNMGWDGDDDVWYNLPNIDAASIDPTASSFEIVDSTIYNIYISGTGEIISGRVTAADTNTPISGATVTAVMTGGGTYQTTTNTNGIYALANVPSNSTYTISVASYGHSFTDQTANTGQSQNGAVTSGNCWAIDFVSSQDVVAIPVVGSFNSSVSGEVTFTAWTDSNYPV